MPVDQRAYKTTDHHRQAFEIQETQGSLVEHDLDCGWELIIRFLKDHARGDFGQQIKPPGVTAGRRGFLCSPNLARRFAEGGVVRADFALQRGGHKTDRELGSSAEVFCQPERRACRNAALAAHNLIDPADEHVQLQRETVLADHHWLQEFFQHDFAGMHRRPFG